MKEEKKCTVVNKICTWTQDRLNILCECGMSHQRFSMDAEQYSFLPFCCNSFTRSAFTYTHSCVSLRKKKPPKSSILLPNKLVGGHGCELHVFMSKMLCPPCYCMFVWVDGGDEDYRARYTKSERMHHSLTERGQSPVRSA